MRSLILSDAISIIYPTYAHISILSTNVISHYDPKNWPSLDSENFSSRISFASTNILYVDLTYSLLLLMCSSIYIVPSVQSEVKRKIKSWLFCTILIFSTTTYHHHNTLALDKCRYSDVAHIFLMTLSGIDNGWSVSVLWTYKFMRCPPIFFTGYKCSSSIYLSDQPRTCNLRFSSAT